ncbi:MAG: hypothetical protein KAV98_06600 [Dehalococcoidia bacterium]|nr:hypothetical protein [Dehalococcoidia bacterium]
MKLAFFKLSKWIAAFAVLVTVIFLIGGCAPANHPPVITNLKAEPETLPSSGSCWIECVASDEDGDELSYEWSAGKGDINGDGATVAWTAPETEGIYNIMVRVTDGNGGEATDSVTITVKDNHPPTITSLIADADWVTPSGSCRIECYAEDPDDDELNYEWAASEGDISSTGSVITWTAPDAEGLYNITVVVTDGYGGEATRPLDVSVSLNPLPVIESLIVTPKGHEYLKEYDGGYKVGKAKSCEIECVVTDAGDGLVYEWSASGDDTDGGEISGEGSVITWTAPDRAVEVTVTVTVSDAAGSMVSKSIVFTVVSCSACTFG